MTQTMRVSSPGELAEIVPYLIGFTPQESLVVLLIDSGRVRLTTRVDLVDTYQPGQIEQLMDLLESRYPDDNAIFIAYTASHDLGWSVIERCIQRRSADKSAEALRFIVDGSTWLLPSGEMGGVNTFGRVAAEATVHGMNRGVSREALEASFATAELNAELVELIEAVLVSLSVEIEALVAAECMHDLLQANLRGDVDQARAVELAILSANPDARQLAALSITSDNAEAHFCLWQRVVNQVPDTLARSPLVLAGLAARATGNGAAANIARDKAQRLAGGDGPHMFEGLLDSLIRSAASPDTWTTLRQEVLDRVGSEIKLAC